MRFIVEGLFIKVSGVTTEEDALFSIGLGANAVGFEFGPTPRRVSPDDVHDILRRLPQGAISIGVFRGELPSRIVQIANRLGLSAVQIDGPAAAEEISYVAERVNTVLRSLPSTAIAAAPSGVDYLVLPEADDQNSLIDSLGVFADESLSVPVIASGGLNESNVVDVVQNYPVFGVDVRGGVEVAPGVKDPARLGAFIANARWAYENSYVARRFEEWF